MFNVKASKDLILKFTPVFKFFCVKGKIVVLCFKASKIIFFSKHKQHMTLQEMQKIYKKPNNKFEHKFFSHKKERAVTAKLYFFVFRFFSKS